MAAASNAVEIHARYITDQPSWYLEPYDGARDV